MQLELVKPKITFNRLESLLIVVPFLVLVFSKIFTALANLDPHYTTTYFTFRFTNVIFFSWTLLIIPFILHLFLKQNNRGDARIVHGHIILSLLLMVSVLFTYELFTPTLVLYDFQYIGLPQQRQWMEATSSTFSLIILQSFLQLLFILYSLVKLLP